MRIAQSLATLAIACALPLQAEAVVLAGDPPDLDSHPPNDYVGKIGGLNGVYLGNRWAITAAHVAHLTRIEEPDPPADFQVAGQVLRIDPSSVTTLESASGQPDLALFRVSSAPDLPALPIASTTPARNHEVSLVGRGRDRSGPLRYWSRTFSPVARELASYLGFDLGDTHTKRWGTNRVVDTARMPGPRNTQTYVFATRFDADGGPREAQVTSGDSGGGVFQRRADGRWELCGVSIGAAGEGGQDRVLFGALSLIADLSRYRAEIERITTLTTPPKGHTPES